MNRKLRSRAPKRSHPRRVGSTYLLSGLVRCRACNRALSGQDAKSGRFAYYVCQSVMKRGSGACDAPRLNARRFEEMVVGKIRENVLTESNIRELVKLVDEEMDGIAREQRQKLETIESELVDVKRRLERLYDLAETTDLDIEDFKPRIRDHRERQERLEASAAEARTILSQRREVLDDVETITAYSQDMSVFLNESELTERRAFIESFVKEIVVMPGNAVVSYTIPISQSTPKTAVLLGGRPEELWVGSTAEAPSQLAWKTGPFYRGGARGGSLQSSHGSVDPSGRVLDLDDVGRVSLRTMRVHLVPRSDKAPRRVDAMKGEKPD